MHITPSEVQVANDAHNGWVRLRLSDYLGPAAQEHLDDLVARSRDIDGAMLLSESQIVIVEATARTADYDTLKAKANGFGSAIKTWFNGLDEDQRVLVTHHPNFTREAHEAYSAPTSWSPVDTA